MQARMRNPAILLPEAMAALQALVKAVEPTLPPKTAGLVHLRASQMNGCGVCLDLHRFFDKKTGETLERTLTVAGWRDAPYFTDAERAALALTEAVTQLGRDGVPDEIWNEAAKHYDETQLAGLVLHIATVNVWNRLNVTTRQVAGKIEWKPAA
jgi:AhpD family alkylhydroperoxidase